MPRYFIFDTNSLIGAILKPQGVSMQAVSIAEKNGKLVFTDETEEELLSVLKRPKFDNYIGLNQRLELASNILSQSEKITPLSFNDIECRDNTDVKFLALALTCTATCLVTVDKDLKVLNPFRKIPIFSPLEFLRWIQ